MPPASTSSDAATADSRPTRRAIRGASGAKAPKQSTGSVVSNPAMAGERPVSARRSPSSGATATTAGRPLRATATTAAVNSTAAQPERAVPPVLVTDPLPAGAPVSAGGGDHPGADGGPGA